MRRAETQLCLSNPEVAERVRRALAESFRKGPPSSAVAAHVAQNDNLWWCECSRCTALAARYGGRSGLLLHFLNPVAHWTSREFPGKRIATLAYMYTQGPPRGVEPDPNLVIRFCNYRPHCQIHPLASCPKNRTNYRDLEGWARLTRSLHVYEYMINFRLFPLPCPNLGAMAENIRLYRSLGVEGVYYSGTPSPAAWMAELKSYLAARWLWDPDEAPGRIEKEFLAGYYGPAAGAVGRALDLTRQAAASAGVHPDLYGYGSKDAWGEPYTERLDRILADADKMAAQEDALAERLLPLKLTSALLRALRPQRAPADVEALGRLARALGADPLGGAIPAESLDRRLRALLPGAGLKLHTPHGKVACTLLPALGGHLTGLRIEGRPFLNRPTQDPLRPEGIRWILGGADDAWSPACMEVDKAGFDEAVLSRSLGPDAARCRVEIRTALRENPAAVKFIARLTNPSDRPCRVPLSLGLTMADVPEVRIDGTTPPVRFDHPLKSALIRVDTAGAVSLSYAKAGITLTLAADIGPQSLFIPARPREARIPLRVTYGALTLQPDAEATHTFWIFLQPH